MSDSEAPSKFSKLRDQLQAMLERQARGGLAKYPDIAEYRAFRRVCLNEALGQLAVEADPAWEEIALCCPAGDDSEDGGGPWYEKSWENDERVPLEVGIEAQDYKSNRAQLVHWWNRQTPYWDRRHGRQSKAPAPEARPRAETGVLMDVEGATAPEVTAPAASEELAASAGAAAAAEALEPEVGTAVQVEASGPAMIAASTKDEGRKRGPKPFGEEVPQQVALIVDRVAPNGDWRSKLPDVQEALDEDKIPLPRGWKQKGADWLDPPDKPTLVKAIKERLKRVRGKSKTETPA